LADVFARHESLAVAVSGGVDSMTLAHIAHRQPGVAIRMVHAISPAVPAAATARVRRHADRHGWALTEINAGEFADVRYRTNPLNRCYFCKVNLYDRIAAVTGLPIASGTNRDDLSDFRPGLRAAAERRVVHPFVEVGVGKSDIYALAESLDLHDLAALPPQPCLASRVETGIAIDAEDLALIERVETQVAEHVGDTTAIRCRITRVGVVVECTPLPEPTITAELAARVTGLVQGSGKSFAGIRPYRRGSAFLHTPAL
jgi:uncharacterized protein